MLAWVKPAPLVRNVKLSKVSACSALKPHERCAGYNHLCLGELLSFQQFDERLDDEVLFIFDQLTSKFGGHIQNCQTWIMALGLGAQRQQS